MWKKERFAVGMGGAMVKYKQIAPQFPASPFLTLRFAIGEACAVQEIVNKIYHRD